MKSAAAHLEVDAHVEGWRVVGLDTQVSDAQPLVGPGVLATGCESVRDVRVMPSGTLPVVVGYFPALRAGLEG